jgi:hypothetical protein
VTDIEELGRRVAEAGHRRWQDIAADMIEAGWLSIKGNCTDEELAAAAFVFDEGILYLPESARLEVISALRSTKGNALSSIRPNGGAEE